MATNKLKLSRDQLATFLKNHEQIKQFERLFQVADEVSPATDTQGIGIQAGNAEAAANEALAQLARLAQETSVCCSITDAKAAHVLNQIALLAQETAVSIASTENKVNQAMSLLSQLAMTVEGLQMSPPPREFKRSRYGSFLDTTTQAAGTINTATPITFNTTNLSRGVYLGTPTSRVYVDTEGVYDFQASLQLDSTVSTDEHFYLWIAVNGTDVPNSASTVRLKGNDAETILALNFFLSLKAGDYVEFYYSVTNLGVRMQYVAATPPVPAIPSIILTVSNNIQGVQP